MGPFDKIWSFGDSWLLAILQKCPTSTMHNLFNFELLEVLLDFLESFRFPITNPFSLISFWYSILVSAFFDLGVWIWIVGSCILLKMSFGWVIAHKVWESYAWSKLSCGLIYEVVIPHKFKIPTFAKYDGVSCPKLHQKYYVHKIQSHTIDKKLWVLFFKRAWLERN